MRVRVRQRLVGLLSLVIVAGLAAFVFLPSQPSVTLSVREVDKAPAGQYVEAEYDLTAVQIAAPKRKKHTIYGTVASPDGVPVAKARLVIRGVGKLKRERAVVKIGKRTTYRSVVRLKPGRYRFELSLRAAGKMRKVKTTQKLRAGRAYEVSVRVADRGVLTMLPISGY